MNQNHLSDIVIAFDFSNF